MNTGPDINELLRQSFLELDQSNPANDQLFDAASQHVFSKEWPLNTATPSSVAVKAAWFSSPLFLGLGGLALAGIVATGIYFYSWKSDALPKTFVTANTARVSEKNSSPDNSNALKNEQPKQISDAYSNSFAENTKTHANKQGIEILLNSVSSPSTELVEPINGQASVSNVNSVAVSSIAPFVDKSLLLFSEVSQTKLGAEKQKLVMSLTADITNHLPLIPGAQGPYNDKSFQVPFYMWPTEITVGEYMLFLNDLIQEGKHEEYNLARPRLDVGYGVKLSDADRNFFTRYFTDSAYVNHPMVFISTDGAYLYCYWLQKLIQSCTDGSKTVVVRLPNKGEWERAASGGNPDFIYGTKSGHLSSGILHNHAEANFKMTQQNNFDFLSSGSVQSGSENSRKIVKNNFFTTPVRSYAANAYRLFDMSGNVSEMVTDRAGKIIVKGGNWNSNEEFLRIRDEDFNEFPVGAYACPFIGFRPVINIK